MKTVVKQKLLKVGVPVVAVIAVIFAGYFYSQVRVLKQDPQLAAQQEVASLVEKISKLMVVPVEEIPTVATVSDPEALKDQAFFTNAQKGDKVLIYAEAKKAILYSVTLDKIIDVAPLNIGDQKAVTPPAPKPATTTAE